MTLKEDYRIKKTKRSLISAFMKLLEEKSIDDITVVELCDRADVRRTTFYKHYRDKNDYVMSFSEILRKKFDALYKSDSDEVSVSYFVEYARHMIYFIAQHEGIINNIRESTLFPTVLTALNEQNYEDTYKYLVRYKENGGELFCSCEVAASMIVGGVSGVIQTWLKSAEKRPAGEIADEVADIIKRIFSEK